MLTTLLASFAVSLVLTLWVVRIARRRPQLFGDSDLSGPQKFHARVVPRVGGIGIALGFLAAAAYVAWSQPAHAGIVAGLLVSAIPVFAAGLWEDLTKRVSPRNRLLAAAASAGLAAWLLGAVIERTSIPGVQWIAGFSAGALLLTLFVVSGVVNAINIIDGMNGHLGAVADQQLAVGAVERQARAVVPVGGLRLELIQRCLEGGLALPRCRALDQ